MCHFRVYPAGNILSLTNGTWDEMIGKTEICSYEEKTLDVFMPWQMGMTEGQHHCEKYWGNMTVIEDSKMWANLLAENISSNIANNRIWSGFSDEDSKGHFVDIVTGSKVPDNSMFAVGDAVGDGNCVFIHESRYHVGPCNIPIAFFLCRLRQKPRFQMRGVFWCNTV